MISILIPTYNYRIVDLIECLARQIQISKAYYEILVIEDGSTDQACLAANKEISNNEGVIYENLNKNIGRNRIRLLLAQKAKFFNLLFLDADSRLPDDQFLQRYEKFLNKFDIVYGGRIYNTRQHVSPEKKLHYLYGKEREEKLITKESPKGKNFLSCNFLIKKDIFLNLKFDANLTGYGHEDTFMLLQFLKNRNSLTHITNPVFHEQLVAEDKFIENQQQALHNIEYLYATYKNDYDFSVVRVISVYKKFFSFVAGKQLLKILASKHSFLLKKLRSTKNLLVLDMWKLSYFAFLQKANKH